jgi:hypothetical protein
VVDIGLAPVSLERTVLFELLVELAADLPNAGQEVASLARFLEHLQLHLQRAADSRVLPILSVRMSVVGLGK